MKRRYAVFEPFKQEIKLLGSTGHLGIAAIREYSKLPSQKSAHGSERECLRRSL